MDIFIPDDEIRPEIRKYGKYKSITECSVSLGYSEFLQYRMYCGTSVTEECSVYSISVTLWQYGKNMESEFVFDICRDSKTADGIFDIICRNTVLPENLFEAVDVIINELV